MNGTQRPNQPESESEPSQPLVGGESADTPQSSPVGQAPQTGPGRLPDEQPPVEGPTPDKAPAAPETAPAQPPEAAQSAEAVKASEVVEPAKAAAEPEDRARPDAPWSGPGEVRMVGRTPSAGRRASDNTGGGDDNGDEAGDEAGDEEDEYGEGEGLLPLRLVPAGWRRNLLIGGTAAATVVVGLSELTSAWVVLVLPLLVAAMVAYIEMLDRVLYPDSPDEPRADGTDGSDSGPAGEGQGTPDSAAGTGARGQVP